MDDKLRDWCSKLGFDYWPSTCSPEDLFVKRERDFHDYLEVNRHAQKRLGWSRIIKSSGHFPDIVADVGATKGLRVEVELDAVNFLLHGHPLTCHLILSYKRPIDFNSFRGIQIWSFYKYQPQRPSEFYWSLRDDIRWTGVDFDLETLEGIHRIGKNGNRILVMSSESTLGAKAGGWARRLPVESAPMPSPYEPAQLG